MEVTYPADLPNFAVVGKAGAGKDTIAELLQWRFTCGYLRIALADPLKGIAAQLWGNDARKDRAKLQALGLKVRDIHEDTWVDVLLRRMAQQEATLVWPDHVRWVVTDVRFPNELTALVSRGFKVLRVVAPRHVRIDRLRQNGKLQDESELDHVSETALDNYEEDFLINNEVNDHTPLVEQLTRILNRARR